MRVAILLALTLPLLLPLPARAVDYVLVLWGRSKRCEIVVKRPFLGEWTELGQYPTRKEAEGALTRYIQLKTCAAPRDAEKPKAKKG